MDGFMIRQLTFFISDLMGIRDVLLACFEEAGYGGEFEEAFETIFDEDFESADEFELFWFDILEEELIESFKNLLSDHQISYEFLIQSFDQTGTHYYLERQIGTQPPQYIPCDKDGCPIFKLSELQKVTNLQDFLQANSLTFEQAYRLAN